MKTLIHIATLPLPPDASHRAPSRKTTVDISSYHHSAAKSALFQILSFPHLRCISFQLWLGSKLLCLWPDYICLLHIGTFFSWCRYLNTKLTIVLKCWYYTCYSLGFCSCFRWGMSPFMKFNNSIIKMMPMFTYTSLVYCACLAVFYFVVKTKSTWQEHSASSWTNTNIHMLKNITPISLLSNQPQRPFNHFLASLLLKLGSLGLLEPILNLILGWRQGCTLDKSPVHHKAT